MVIDLLSRLTIATARPMEWLQPLLLLGIDTNQGRLEGHDGDQTENELELFITINILAGEKWFLSGQEKADKEPQPTN